MLDNYKEIIKNTFICTELSDNLGNDKRLTQFNKNKPLNIFFLHEYNNNIPSYRNYFNKFDFSISPQRFNNKSQLKIYKNNYDPLEEKIIGISPYGAFITVVSERIQPLIPFNIKQVLTVEEADIIVTFIGDIGSWAIIGSDNEKGEKINKISINIDKLYVWNIIHQMCHILGMKHEHEKPKNQIKYNKQFLYDYYKEIFNWDEQTVNENIIERYNTTQLNGNDFDPKSIMLYQGENYSLPIQDHKLRFSYNDISWIVKTYGYTVNINKFYDSILLKTKIDKFISYSIILIFNFIVFMVFTKILFENFLNMELSYYEIYELIKNSLIFQFDIIIESIIRFNRIIGAIFNRIFTRHQHVL